jgi:CheY-like chemotaxis protein
MPDAALRDRRSRQGRVHTTQCWPHCWFTQDRASSFPVAGLEIQHASRLEKAAGRSVAGRTAKILQEGADSHTMRPKKVILCVDDNEQDLSVLKFMLTTNGYRVVSAIGGQEAVGIFSELQVDLVLADFAMPQMNGGQLVDRLKQIAPHVPMILLGDPQRMSGEMYAADALLAKKNCTPQELLERIKVMSARKRGPRKGTVRMAPPVELAVAS